MKRCLIVCPGGLAEQWQDELDRRFQLPFQIMTNDNLEAARTGNWFRENNLAIARLDKLSRNEDVQQRLQAPDCGWDLVVCDEAHKLSASFFGREIKYTKRYRLGQLLSTLTRHFLLMTATPHNGKEEDFQLFMALLDGDRFEGRFRDGAHQTDISDLMRRVVKENLVKFDGTPLFPERIAHTIPYRLSDGEARLYAEVTEYVTEEFNRAEALASDKRAGTVGFALTILQRRLASSPEAIYQSLRRRHERLGKRLRELELLQRGAAVDAIAVEAESLDAEELEDIEDAPEEEAAAAEEQVLDRATAARTIAELRAELATLERLVRLAQTVRQSGEDRKWVELAELLRGMAVTPNRSAVAPEKLVVFTEHRDTLHYLQLDLEAKLSALPPVALGGFVVVPVGLLARMQAVAPAEPAVQVTARPADTQAAAARAREIVMAEERRLGFEPTDREFERLGYDIESRNPATGKLRFLEVKGRAAGADTITVTRNEILYSLNRPEDFILAIVEFLDGGTHRLHYVRQPFQREPDFAVTSVNYDLPDLLARAETAGIS
ncbi:MAG TPA: DUF3883 domain-containing protein [Terriglobales bacterium]|nr:DUF3883 domain-containing protein [Terriglobales bacterium]